MNGDSQWMRLAQALVLGPYMMYTASQVKHPWFRRGLMVVGAGTSLVGAHQWLTHRADEGLFGLGTYPLNPADTAAVESWWSTVYPYQPAQFSDIDWQAIGFDGHGLSPEAAAFMERIWPEIRVAANWSDINWEAHAGEESIYPGAPAPAALPAPNGKPDVRGQRFDTAELERLERKALEAARAGDVARQAAIEQILAQQREREARLKEQRITAQPVGEPATLDEGRSGATPGYAGGGGAAGGGYAVAPRPSRDVSADEAADAARATAAGGLSTPPLWVIPVGVGVFLWWKSRNKTRGRGRTGKSSRARRRRRTA